MKKIPGIADVQKLVKATHLPPGFSFDVGGATKEQEDAFAAMISAMGLAVIFIYIVLASQFGGFLQPLAIVASLPPALIGVMLALLAFGSTLNVFSMIGLAICSKFSTSHREKTGIQQRGDRDPNSVRTDHADHAQRGGVRAGGHHAGDREEAARGALGAAGLDLGR